MFRTLHPNLATSPVDLAGRVLVVITTFMVLLLVPGFIGYVRREIAWRRVERVRDRWRRTR